MIMANNKPNYVQKLKRESNSTTKSTFLSAHKLKNIKLIKPFETKEKRNKNYIITEKGLEVANILIKVDNILR